MGRLEAVVKVTILFLLWSGEIIFSQGKVREFKVDLLCEPCSGMYMVIYSTMHV